jgi:NAD(P)-dependent dehydrogenase (short-subunit alcohol dehydrogenase family)
VSDGKRVLVTGSSSGFGRLVVSALLGRGWHVYATLRDAEARAELFALDRERHGARLVLLPLDVTDAGQRAAVAARVAADGGLDCLINNAGYALCGALEDLDEAQLRHQLEVNFFGAALVTKALLPGLRANQGVVLNVSSVFGITGFPLTGAYCASKYALEGLTESLYYELKPLGVRVGLVEPGGHRTNFGASIEWGAGATEAYRALTAGYHRLRERITSRPNATGPEGVVATLVRLAEARSVPLRTVVGKDALFTAALQALVPERLRAPAMSAMVTRLLSKGPA